MNKILTLVMAVASLPALASANIATTDTPQGRLSLIPYSAGAVRVVMQSDPNASILPDDDLYYLQAPDGTFDTVTDTNEALTATFGEYVVKYDKTTGVLSLTSTDGRMLSNCTLSNVPDKVSDATAEFSTADGERIYGTGQFQDGHNDVNGLTRRLTQVNTQISVPMVISNRGYGLLWNNYGLTDFNPSEEFTLLKAVGDEGETEEVDVTGTTGNRREQRNFGAFEGEIEVPSDGDYSILLDVGQQMARRHQMKIDGVTVCDMRNLWLPPTTSVIVPLKAGKHRVEVTGEKNDRPMVGMRKVDGKMVWHSPVANAIDFTYFTGTPDNIIHQYRRITGPVPKMPAWGLGYIHCRERFCSQDDLLANATEFRRQGIPVDIMVQDWQYWGKYGWNAMRFDEQHYPDPKAMTDSLHAMDMRLMVSVWAKADRNSDLGRRMAAKGYYIDDKCDWIDFFNPDAAAEYVRSYNDYLLPAGIDAWWQDATEPENDDLHGRKVNRGTVDGDRYRNVFPLVVNDNVYRGMTEARPGVRQMILTRSAAPGIQRYGVSTWSGDVGNDWNTLKCQIAGGLGQMATGLPWWTYDAGGFFRPGDQYTNADYQQCMLKWIETSVFLPLMRVHGYQSMTEPWRYPQTTKDEFARSISLRYSLLPYIYSEAMRVSAEDGTLMRPMVFDFYADDEALAAAEQSCMYMFGPALLVSPNIDNGATTKVNLPNVPGGWYHLLNGSPAQGLTDIPDEGGRLSLPVYVKAGSIIPWRDPQGVRSSVDALNSEQLIVKVYPGADGQFTLWEDDGVSTSDEHSAITFTWNDAKRTVTVSQRSGSFKGMPAKRIFTFVLPNGSSTKLKYSGSKKTVKLK